MGIRAHMPPGATPVAAIDAIFAALGRERVEIAIEAMVAILDVIDGDADLEDVIDEDVEPNGDDMGDQAIPEGIGGAQGPS